MERLILYSKHKWTYDLLFGEMVENIARDTARVAWRESQGLGVTMTFRVGVHGPEVSAAMPRPVERDEKAFL